MNKNTLISNQNGHINPVFAGKNAYSSQLGQPPCVSVKIIQTGEYFKCHHGESLLSAMIRLGHRGIPVGCVNGGCGVCKVRILEGEDQSMGPASAAHVSHEEFTHGYRLACRVSPLTDIDIEVCQKLYKPFSLNKA